MTARTETLRPGVHRVTDDVVNLYLIEVDGQLTVIDTGWRRSWPSIEQALGSLGRSTSDVAAVLLTHAHADHLGSAEKLRVTTGAPVRTSPIEAGRAQGRGRGPWSMVPGLLPQVWRPTTLGFVLHASLHGFLTPQWVQQVEPFTVGQAVDAPGSPMAVATPGHTDGHTSFHLPDLGVLVTGDALLTMDPLTRRRGPQVSAPALCDDHDVARRSLEALEGLSGDLVLPGHGEPFAGTPTEAVRQARAALG